MDIVVGSIVHLQPLHGACRRTKNRIHEHGACGFEIVRFNPHSSLFNGSPAVLFRSVSKTFAGKETWLGWIPLLEITNV
jgi:hypothetical protein